ncbi:Ig-like domain-containing protein, partial [Methanobrevibacter arboriphilus]|uniref:Ig-like domain-containing protein n=1 Tax=Methanobrevibacter arboriphilus TaxID=39441 RepID=UPI000AA09A95
LDGYFGNGSDKLIVTVDGDDYEVNIGYNGVWSLNYKAPHVGIITVIVNLLENPYYENFVNSTSFNVLKADTNSTIIIDSSSVFVGDNIVISGHLANYTGIDSVNVTVDGHTELVHVNEAGFWNLNYIATRAGTFDVIVSLFENSNYEDFVNSTSFNVNRFNVVSTLAVSGKFTYGETIKLKSKLTKGTNGLALKGKLVKFYVNNKLVGSKKTDSNGIAAFNYKIDSTKKLTFKSVFAGDSEYNNKTSNIISKTPSKAKISMVLSSKLYKKRIKVTLKFKRKALKLKWVKFYVKSKYVGKAKTNSKGIALFKYTKKTWKINY